MAEVLSSNLNEPIYTISDDAIWEYLSFLELKGVTKGHINEVHRYLKNYKKYILNVVDKQKSLEYFKKLQRECSDAYYLKQMYQIKKFLLHLNCEWIQYIQLPKNPTYIPKRITIQDIESTLQYFKENPHYLQVKALVLLGSSSGLRAEELYQLNKQDIDLSTRIVKVNHNLMNGQTTKTGKTRTSFFNSRAKDALITYFNFYENGCNYSKLFSQTTLTRMFHSSTIKVKHLRKLFSQEWDRRGGPTSIKKLLMGHSTRGDVDLSHYNAQSEEDLKKIYDKVMGM